MDRLRFICQIDYIGSQCEHIRAPNEAGQIHLNHQLFLRNGLHFILSEK